MAPAHPLASWFLPLGFLVASVAFGAPENGAEKGKRAGKAAEEVTFSPPAGWERSEQERIVVFTPPGLSPAKCALIVTPGETLDGDFLKWFKGKWEALRKGTKVVQGGDRTGQDGPNGSSVLYQAAMLEAEGDANAVKKRTGLLLYAVHVGPAVHWVVFRTDGPELFNKHKKTVNQFLAGMKFVETKPAADDGGPEKVKPPTRAKPKPRGAPRRQPNRPGRIVERRPWVPRATRSLTSSGSRN